LPLPPALTLTALALIGTAALLTACNWVFEAAAETRHASTQLLSSIQTFTVGVELVAAVWIVADGASLLNIGILMASLTSATATIAVNRIRPLRTHADRLVTYVSDRMAQGEALAEVDR
jgi:hypothetical protein